MTAIFRPDMSGCFRLPWLALFYYRARGPWSNFTEAVASVNGFMFSGMFTDYQEESGAITGYGQRGKYIIDHVMEQNKKGVWLPLFAVCKGFNMLAFFLSGVAHWRDLVRDDINANDWPAPIAFNENSDYKKSKFYKAANSTNSIAPMLEGPNLMNRHPYGILPANYSSNANLTSIFGPYLATTIDASGVEFVSVVEHPEYPIYGAATHPEKVIYEWRTTISTPRSEEAFRANLWFSHLIGSDSRRNDRKFASSSTESSLLTYSNQVADMRSYVGGEFREAFFSVPKSSSSDTPPVTSDSSSCGDDNKDSIPLATFIAVSVSLFAAGLLAGVGGCLLTRHSGIGKTQDTDTELSRINPYMFSSSKDV
jgi:hypothetical protein